MNLLFIQSDQLSANAVSYAGCPYVQTPHIDRLAARSISFTQAYCAFPKCVPNRTAWLHGRMPHQLFLPGTERDLAAQLGNKQRGVKPEFANEEMGKWFSKAGYKCAHAGKWHIKQWGPTESLEEGFESGFEPLCRINDPEVPRACHRFFKEHDGSRPFLLVASFDNPHNICEYAWGGPLPWGNLPEPPGVHELPPFPGNHFQTPDEPTALRHMRAAVEETLGYQPDDWRRYRWAYYRLVEKVDAEIGRLLDALDGAGLTDSTAIVFTADHGDMQGSHGLAQKDTFYEESARVPFLLSIPGHPQGEVRDDLVNNALDIYPTFCELAGIDPPDDFHGRSLVSTSASETMSLGREFIAGEVKFLRGPGEARMIRSQRFKYIAYDRGPHAEQLFDLERDPGEMTNLAETSVFEDELLRHREYLRGWLKATDDVEFGNTNYTHPGVRLQIPGDDYPDPSV